MTMRLKVCGMREPDNLRELIDQVNPEFVGFIFHPGSPRYFPDGPKEMPADLPPGKRTGVFVNTSYHEVVELAEMFNLRNLQLHGTESAESCRRLREMGFTIIKAFGVKSQDDFQKAKAYHEACDFFLFDTKTPKHGGSGEKFNWEMLDKVDISKPYFLSGGIDLDDANDICNLKHQPYAIDINSRFEIKPAFKDIEKIKKFKKRINNE